MENTREKEKTRELSCSNGVKNTGPHRNEQQAVHCILCQRFENRNELTTKKETSIEFRTLIKVNE